MSKQLKMEIAIIDGKIAILHKHLAKRPIAKNHEEFLTKRLLICVTEKSQLEQQIFTDKLNYVKQ